MQIKTPTEIIMIAATIILITVGTTFLIDGVLKNIIEFDNKNYNYLNWFAFGSIGLILLTLGMVLARTITQDICKPDRRSFQEITNHAYKLTLRKTKVVITSISEIRDQPNEKIQNCINLLFSNFPVEKICQTDYKDLTSKLKNLNYDEDTVLASFPWQQQLRLIYEVTKINNNTKFVIISSEQSTKQLPAFKHMLKLLGEELKQENKIFTFSMTDPVNFNEIDKVSVMIESKINEHSTLNPDENIMVDVTAGQKTYSLAAVLSTVDKKHVYTGYVDTNAPWPLHLQNIVNNNKNELAVT